MGRVTPPESLSHPGSASPADPDASRDAPLRVVLAPNAFKGTLTAVEACAAMTEGVHRVAPDAVVDAAPIADGGDGSVDAFVQAGFIRRSVVTRGPTGSTVQAAYATDGDVAVVELADACGMGRLPDGRLAPMESSTLGLGDAIRAALDDRPREVIVCIGGSASTDGGAGMLVALGARLLDSDGEELSPSGAALGRVAVIDASELDPRLLDVRLVVAADVDSPLTGPRGAAEVFSPQKGASPAQVAVLDAALEHWALLLADTFGHDVAEVPGAGAAGGTASALLAVGATLEPGFEVVARVTGLHERIADADAVITGEGRLDGQSALGKGVGGVVAAARTDGVPVLVVCGEIALSAQERDHWGITGYAELASFADSEAEARSHASLLLATATAAALAEWRRV